MRLAARRGYDRAAEVPSRSRAARRRCRRAKTLEAYRRDAALWLAVASFGGDVLERAEPFDAVDLDLGALWRLPPGAKAA